MYVYIYIWYCMYVWQYWTAELKFTYSFPIHWPNHQFLCLQNFHLYDMHMFPFFLLAPSPPSPSPLPHSHTHSPTSLLRVRVQPLACQWCIRRYAWVKTYWPGSTKDSPSRDFKLLLSLPSHLTRTSKEEPCLLQGSSYCWSGHNFHATMVTAEISQLLM